MPNRPHSDYLEIKRHKNKPDQQFHCTLLHREPGYAVLAYKAVKAGLIADISIPAQSTTIAHYWQDRPYVAWRMFDKNFTLLGTLFHICSNVCIQDDQLSYDDLLLDIWITPIGDARILDKDELKTCYKAGTITDDELVCIYDAQQDIIGRSKEIISELTSFDCTP